MKPTVSLTLRWLAACHAMLYSRQGAALYISPRPLLCCSRGLFFLFADPSLPSHRLHHHLGRDDCAAMAGDLAVLAPSTSSGVETENHYWKNVLIIVPVVMCSLATLSYVLRLVCRGIVRAPTIKTEDVLMGIGLLLSYGVTAFTVYSQSFPIAKGCNVETSPTVPG